MTTRHSFRRKLVEFLSGEIDPGEREVLMTHLKDCPSCQAEEARLKRLLDAASARKRDVDRVMDTVDWEKLALRISDAAEGRGQAALRARPAARRPFFGLLFRPVMAYLMAGLFIGGLAMFGVFKAGWLNPSVRPAYVVSRDFLDKAEMELARRETLNYLERSQYLLLDFAQTPPDKAGQLWRKEFSSQQAADLVSSKRFINTQLDKIPMAKAREICDQIESLFLELSQMSGRLSETQWKVIQDRVEQSQLLLKINLVKKELQGREI
jgi:hypothetical protein